MHEMEKLGELEVGGGEVAEAEARGEEHLRQTPHRGVREEVPLQCSQPCTHCGVVSPTR